MSGKRNSPIRRRGRWRGARPSAMAVVRPAWEVLSGSAWLAVQIIRYLAPYYAGAAINRIENALPAASGRRWHPARRGTKRIQSG